MTRAISSTTCSDWHSKAKSRPGGYEGRKETKMNTTRTIRVEHRENPTIESITYKDVVDVRDVFDDNRNYCHQLVLKNGETATFPAIEWKMFELKFVPLF